MSSNRRLAHLDSIAQVKALRAAGLTIAEIAKELRRSTTWVYCRLNPDYAVRRTNQPPMPPLSISLFNEPPSGLDDPDDSNKEEAL